ncbi:MAG: polymer-forming cytoskeletal protein [candidate division Zixibacteria bacterium]|nr:polymer-forming cytoskeletal protein [candidate division Zixibacteria bacterium]
MNTIIGKDTVFTGTLDVTGAIRIDGTVKGRVVCSDTVTVGTGGYVEADIEALSIVVAGKVVGNLTASEKIELQTKSDVEGDLKTKSLVVEEGAIFCGACRMKEKGAELSFLPPLDREEEPLLLRNKMKDEFDK